MQVWPRYTVHRSMVLGESIAGRADLAPAFTRYGAALGEVFQLRDDLIDAFGDSAVSGKPTGQDFAQQKMILLVALAMQRDGRVSRLLAGQSAEGTTFAQIVTDLDVRDEVERRISYLVEQVQAAIATATARCNREYFNRMK